ncbi:M20 family metallopeptidase [Propioniciclava coleopterorum]|uniref:Peptidase M20 domain-containing protein 2 n=1 Tax=Propioniciclava coleopterorum TaxID=2714937 RepID=A0A6G7Y713_9ACTN|nr:M20 family metallopeptidase [Propioniciclava coleopterorum]QIK72407.1 M20 family metallopeptidase [Propioniciclava coleopterorum]
MSHPSSPTVPSPFFSEELAADTAERTATAAPITSPHPGAPDDLREELAADVAALQEPLRALALALHGDPETAFEETRSAERVAALVRAEGLDAEVGAFGRDTAVHAEFTAGEGGRTIAVLAEYDALPDIGHACGHNIICATGVGAFLALHRLAGRRPDAFSGRVVLLGTPGEEGHTGKEYMAREGAFEGLDAAIMLHPYGYDVADQVWLGRRTLTITYTGRAAHASAEPFMGRNALDAATLFYTGIGLLRQQMIPVDRVHAVITQGGTRASIIPEKAVVDVYVRSKFAETLVDLSQRVHDLAVGAATMAGVGVEIAWDQHPPSLPVRSNGPLTERWALAQGERGRRSLPLGVVPETIAASTDFGNVSVRVPGIHPLLKIADENAALHTRDFAEAAASEFALTGIGDGAYGLAATALDFLVDDDLARAVAEDFAAAGGVMDVDHLFPEPQ